MQYIYMHTHTYIHTYLHYITLHSISIALHYMTYIQAYITYIHTCNEGPRFVSQYMENGVYSLHVHTYTDMYKCIYIYTHTCILI